MITYTTCVQCGKLLELSTLQQRTHPDCPPDYLDQLEAAFLAAVVDGDQGQADALAETLDRAEKASTGLLAAAVTYARHGWPVFPCRPRGKSPYAAGKRGGAQHGFQDATTDPERVTRWWQRHPDHNIGVATGHTVDVIDIDYVGKPDALDWWVEVREDPDFEIDGLASTPRGLHVYIQPTGAGPKSKLGEISGVDYRGIGGYVVVPPSVRDDGTYQWLVLPSPRIKHM